MKLFIGNKKYSSWSFRPWIALKQKSIPFEEVLVPFNMAEGNPEFQAFAPHGKVPTLLDGKTRVWESLAIMEYIADKFPDAGLWPENVAERAKARAVSCEMLSGFTGIRGSFPMNMARDPKPHDINTRVQKDLKRITQIWSECLAASNGPFLFGAFTIADAMFAPVVSRIHTYQLSRDENVAAYSKTMRALPAYQEWEDAGKAEPWYVAEDEIDDPNF